MGPDRLAESAADLGFRQAYHNHTWEPASTIGGRSALEVLFDLVDPAVALGAGDLDVAVDVLAASRRYLESIDGGGPI